MLSIAEVVPRSGPAPIAIARRNIPDAKSKGGTSQTNTRTHGVVPFAISSGRAR